MKFYNRAAELQLLATVNKTVPRFAKMTMMVGRRRIGKTRLLFEAYQHTRWVYFFVARKSEPLLCEEFISIAEASLGIKILGDFKSFVSFFEYLMEYSGRENFTLIIDEFQEFYQINPSVYSGIQNVWDRYKDRSQMNLIFSGSIFSLMKKIFENTKKPLFGRADKKILLKPFSVNVLQEIYEEHVKTPIAKNFLAFYALTGGVAKYVEHFVNEKAFTLDKMLSVILRTDSVFVNEGRDMLIEEFGRSYTQYFSILSLIASGKTSRTAIESVLQKDIGGYLNQLESYYNIIKRVQPLFSKPGSRLQRYIIEDNFLNFWFRFIYKNQSAVELGNFDYLKKLIERDFSTYGGQVLEKLFVDKLSLSYQFSSIGNYWERGNQNEIDIVAENKMDKKLAIIEVKYLKSHIKLAALKQKASKLTENFKDYEISYQAYSLEDIFNI